MKKGALAVLLAVIVFTSALMCAAAPVNSYAYKAILPDTPLYASADLAAEILIRLPQNAVVEPAGDPFVSGDTEWVRVKYTSFDGFVVNASLYKSLKNDNFEVIIAKAAAKEMGEEIPLFDTHSSDAAAVRTVHDGEQLRIVTDGVDYGEFVCVEYDGGYYFAYSFNVTTGLSYNQLLAVIISACFVGALIIAAVIVVVLRKRRRKK